MARCSVFHVTSNNYRCCTDYWSNGVEPGKMWDRVGPSPLLLKYVESTDYIPAGKALVPGCGRGYDLVALASAERSVIGLDISETGVAAAKDYLKTVPTSVFRNPENAEVQCRSFFDLDPASNEKDSFDFVYDYTFLCALDPSIRADWADKMAQIIKPGGILLTLIFPIWVSPPATGPPFAVSLDLFEELLLPRGFECLELRMLEKDLCQEGRDGGLDGQGPFTAVGRWRRK